MHRVAQLRFALNDRGNCKYSGAWRSVPTCSAEKNESDEARKTVARQGRGVVTTMDEADALRSSAGVRDLTFSREAVGSLVQSQDGAPVEASTELTIDLSPPSDAAAMLGVPDLELEKIPYNCAYCHTKLHSEYVCSGDVRLSQLGGPWTVCEPCFLKNRPTLPNDASFIHLKGALNQRFAYHALSLRIRNRFICYAPAQCIGEVDPADGKVRYVTYAEVYDHARRLATTLQLVIGKEGVVCLRSENKGWWIAADAVSGLFRSCADLHLTRQRPSRLAGSCAGPLQRLLRPLRCVR
jgi:hypothetical protein